jgi:hypothetical protein
MEHSSIDKINIRGFRLVLQACDCHGISSDFPLTQKYSSSRSYLSDTGQFQHKQPDCRMSSAFSVAFPFAQKSPTFKSEFLKVGQFGQEHIFRFSSLS